MIDIENEIFNKVSTALNTAFTGIFLTGEELMNVPSQFPCAGIYESDNYPVVSTQDSSSNENHSHLVYDINVYTNDKKGKKAKAKAILSTIDDTLSQLGLVRVTKEPVPMSDSTIYRLFARYECITDGNYIYRR